MLPINPIIAAAVADIATGMIIYSDFAFGPLWTKVSGQKCSSKDMPIRYAGQFVASLMASSALYISILTFKKTELPYSHELLTRIYAWFFQDMSMIQTDIASSLKIAGFIWLGILVPFIISNTIWHSTINWQKAALKSVFKLIHLLAMAGALAYFG